MGLDIRLPIGLLFAILGGLLTVYGLVSDPALYERSLGININLWWGLVLLVFGALMVLAGRRKPRPRPEGDPVADGPPEG
jgi:hypothetical protein